MKLAYLTLPLGLATVHAAETTVELKPFQVERSFAATLLPSKPALISIDPKQFSDFTIEQISTHGTKVAKGDVLVKFESKAFNRRLEDQKRAWEAAKLTLASKELAFSKLEAETELKMDAAKRAARIASEDLAYFNESGRKAKEDDAQNDLESARQRLAGAREELNQLKKMYDADDVTEETEEIILKRQQFVVKSAELSMRLTELAIAQRLEKSIPREFEQLTAADQSATLALEKAKEDLPRGLLAAKIDLESAKVALARQEADLKELESDAALLTVVAPINGTFYHGSLDDGRWTLGELAKSLVEGGRVPLIRSFGFVVPDSPEMTMVAQVDETTVRSLTVNLTGNATAAGREDLPLTATVKTISMVPEKDGRFRVDLQPGSALKNQPSVTTGMNLSCNFIVHQNPSVVVLPQKALHPTTEGTWTVELKLTDGKTEARPVTRGHVSGDQVEILSGLEAGQVVIIAD